MAYIMAEQRAPLLSHPSHDGEDFVLYQPNPTKQMLLHDMATSSSVLTYLKMNNIPTAIKHLPNTESMSENGRMPVVFEKDTDKLMCGFTEVFWHIARKSNRTPTLHELSYMDWVESKFLEAELYICWCHEPVLNEYTKNRYTYDLPWPVSSILFERRRKQVQNDVGKKFKNFEDFLDKFDNFLNQLNKRLKKKGYSLSETSPSCVDALIYGHSKAIETTNLHPRFVNAVTKQRRMANLKDLVNEKYPS